MRELLLLLLLLQTFASVVVSQSPNLGVPFIQSFSREVYQSGASNWEILQDERGMIYFANNDGLLSFDGSNWKLYPLPNRTIVRAIALSPEGVIYAGGQNEFGRFIPESGGEWKYEDLRWRISSEEHKNFEDVWDIVLIEKEQLLFRASGKIFRMKEGKIEVMPIEGNALFLGGSPEQILVQLENGKVFKVDGDDLSPLEVPDQAGLSLIMSTTPIGEQLMLATDVSGLFILKGNKIIPWKTDADDFLFEQHIVSIQQVLGDRLAIGTDFGGLVVIDSTGKSIYHLDQQSGLLNNTILSLFEDQGRNLWLGFRNGIGHVELNSPFTMIYSEGTGYAVKIHEDKIYFATNNGLFANDWKSYYPPFSPVDFRMINQSKGQNWGLQIIDNQLFLGNTKGAFQIVGNQAVELYNATGVWCFDSLYNSPGSMIAGSYTGISLFKKEGNWRFVRELESIRESCRFIEQDNKGNIWMSHPYRGIFRIRFDQENNQTTINAYDERQGLPSANLNHVFKIKEDIIFCGEKGVFLFDYENERFYPYDAFNNIFGAQTKVRRLTEAANEDIWFITEDELGVLKIEDRGLEKKVEKKVFSQFKGMLNAGFEAIYPYDANNVFITSDHGFVHYNPLEFLEKPDTQQIILNEVRVTANDVDSLLFAGVFSDEHQIKTQQSENSIPEVPSHMNAFLFRFSTPFFKKNLLPAYRYHLEGFEEKWSDWTEVNLKEYTNLRPGTYTFHLQSSVETEDVLANLAYTFVINPPWYASLPAYLSYLLFFGLLIGTIVRKYRKKYYGLKAVSEQTIKQSELEIVKLREEKINAELEYKKRELVSATLHLVKKNETINQIRERLSEIKKKNPDVKINRQLQQLIKMMAQDELVDEGWEDLMLHFNQLHEDFFERLKSSYPDLTPKDLKMCAYLRMNLSTKELASLLNVTPRGVEASRYRLRKKMKMKKEENLTEFMMSF